MKNIFLKEKKSNSSSKAKWWVMTTLIIGVVLISSCDKNQKSDDLVSKLKLLEEKTALLKELEQEIADLKVEIGKAKPEILKVAKEITTDTLKPTLFERFVTLQATVQPYEIVNIGSDIGGRITRIFVKEGQRISKGQLIASTDMEGLEKQIEELQVSLELARDVYQRQSRLWKQNIGSEIQYLQAKNNKERLEKSLAALQTNYSKRNVYSPISGIVQAELLKEGEVATPGIPIIRAFSDKNLKVSADVPESYLGKVKLGDLVEIELPALGKTMKRKVTLIGSTVDPTNRTFKIEIAIDNPDNSIKPNLLALVKIQDLKINNALAIPLNLILEEVDGQKYVFVVERKPNGEEVCRKRYVTTGEVSGDKAIIWEGIEANEEYINLGARNLSDGDPIKRK